jgi:hypothetical protein
MTERRSSRGKAKVDYSQQLGGGSESDDEDSQARFDGSDDDAWQEGEEEGEGDDEVLDLTADMDEAPRAGAGSARKSAARQSAPAAKKPAAKAAAAVAKPPDRPPAAPAAPAASASASDKPKGVLQLRAPSKVPMRPEIAQMRSIVGDNHGDDLLAKVLEAANWKLDIAVNRFMDSEAFKQAASGSAASSSSSGPAAKPRAAAGSGSFASPRPAASAGAGAGSAGSGAGSGTKRKAADPVADDSGERAPKRAKTSAADDAEDEAMPQAKQQPQPQPQSMQSPDPVFVRPDWDRKLLGTMTIQVSSNPQGMRDPLLLTSASCVVSC